jgi:hypothetical protein
MSAHTLFLVHGIHSNGNWHETLAKAVDPFFVCKAIKYREYHALGAINIFYWPWAILFAGLLGWVAVPRVAAVDVRWIWVVMGAMAAWGLFEALKCGPARACCPLLVGAFWLGALGLWWTSLVLAAVWIAIAAVGIAVTNRERQYYGFWVVALIVALAAWGVSWHFVIYKYDQLWLLGTCVGLGAVLLVLWEQDWSGWSWRIALPVAIGAAGFAGAYYAPADLKPAVLWTALVSFMAYLETSESAQGGLVDWRWLAVIGVLSGLLVAFWFAAERAPAAGFACAAIVLAFGYFEPQWRSVRAAWRVSRIAGDQVAGKAKSGLPEFAQQSWIAHSLGAYLSGKVFGPMIPLRHVILVGGAMNEEYEWGKHLHTVPCVFDVRNESSALDAVIRLLYMAGPWAQKRGLGGAGLVGLRPPGYDLHEPGDFRFACVDCPDDPHRQVHNLRPPHFRHSTYFLGDEHIIHYWLPYLWGRAPEDVGGYYAWCLKLLRSASMAPGSARLFKNRLAEFTSIRWNWDWHLHDYQSFGEIVDDALAGVLDRLDERHPGANPKPSQRVIQLTALLVSQRVALALKSRRHGNRDRNLMRYLDPPLGIRHAAKDALVAVLRN